MTSIRSKDYSLKVEELLTDARSYDVVYRMVQDLEKTDKKVDDIDCLTFARGYQSLMEGFGFAPIFGHIGLVKDAAKVIEASRPVSLELTAALDKLVSRVQKGEKISPEDPDLADYQAIELRVKASRELSLGIGYLVKYEKAAA